MCNLKTLTLENIQTAVSGTSTGFRSVTTLQPAGGKGDKVFPPTYEGGTYATETRYIDGEEAPCVLLDSVQSQANRMEEALLDDWREGNIPLPVITVPFENLPKNFAVTSLDAPHRIADALLRDSALGDVPFRQSEVGRILEMTDLRNATGLFKYCPTALIFGIWDSTGPRGGRGVKIQRAIVSEIVGLHAVQGMNTSSRIDPAQIIRAAGPVADADNGWGWELAKDGRGRRPSEVNHGNIPPTIEDGGFTVSKAVQTTVISLPAIRRLRFPIDGHTPTGQIDNIARTVLMTLALLAATLVRERGADLRSRCLLHPVETPCWELLDIPGEEAERFGASGDDLRSIYAQAVGQAKEAGLPWMDEELVLTPSPQLLELVRQSQLITAEQGGE